LCPRIREIPAGVGYRNYSIINGRGHGESCSQLEVEVMIIIASVAPNGSNRDERLIGNIRLRTGIRLAARTIAGAHRREAAAPMKRLRRVIR
jgi:hypothetical protein